MPHNAAPILETVGDRTVKAIVLTHGHNDHVTVAPELSRATARRSCCTPATTCSGTRPIPMSRIVDLEDGQRISVTGTELTVINTPGAFAGFVCGVRAEAGILFSGGTLFHGGPGRRDAPFSSFRRSSNRSRDKIFTLDPETRCTPVTARARRSWGRARIWRSGSRAVTDTPHARRRLARRTPPVWVERPEADQHPGYFAGTA